MPNGGVDLTEVTYKKMGRPKLQRRDWQEPKRKEKYPTLTIKDVAKRLGYSNTQMVEHLAIRGPELGGLPIYIINPDGEGWIRKPPDLKTWNVKSFFFEEDVEAFKASLPPKIKMRHVNYTEEEKQYLLKEAEKFTNDHGEAHRLKLYHHLAQLPDLYRFEVVGESGKAKIRRFVQDIHKQSVIDVCAGTMNDYEMHVMQEAQKLMLRNEPGDKVEARRLLLARFDEAIEISDSKWQWNSRTYKKLKQILEDAGIPDQKIKKH